MEQIFALVNEMSPFLLLGFLFAGILHVFVPSMVYSRYLSGHSFRSVFYAALFGVPLPLCSCGVLPTAMGLRKEGASKGATVSFLIATPETGVDSIAATWSLLGPAFALIRPIAAFITGVVGGTLVSKFDNEKTEATDGEMAALQPDSDMPTGFGGKLIYALRYGFVNLVSSIGLWLVTGLIVAAVITVVFLIIRKTIGLRVTPEEEIAGLDISEHGLLTAYAGFATTPEEVLVDGADGPLDV